jgi:hypothetical protein
VKARDANDVVEELRADTRLYLPALTKRRGFSTSRVEHLLNGLVRKMPKDECYFEVGTLEGRTLEAAAVGNETKMLFACDPCEKYGREPEPFPSNVYFMKRTWRDVLQLEKLPPIGLCFYDGLHDEGETFSFMMELQRYAADELMLVLDDWDRLTVRRGAFRAAGWDLFREMPSYGDGLTCPQDHFGWSFGVALFRYGR